MDHPILLFILGYIILSLILVPFQYRYVEQVNKKRLEHEGKEKKKGDMFDEMEFENQVLHANAQANPLLFLANILATILYKIKHRKK